MSLRYAILGMLSLSSMSGYDMKKFFRRIGDRQRGSPGLHPMPCSPTLDGAASGRRMNIHARKCISPRPCPFRPAGVQFCQKENS